MWNVITDVFPNISSTEWNRLERGMVKTILNQNHKIAYDSYVQSPPHSRETAAPRTISHPPRPRGMIDIWVSDISPSGTSYIQSTEDLGLAVVARGYNRGSFKAVVYSWERQSDWRTLTGRRHRRISCRWAKGEPSGKRMDSSYHQRT